MILIVSSATDIHSHLVMKELRYLKADVTLLDLSKFRQPLELAMHYGSSDRDCALQITSAISLPLNDFRVIWWRCPHIADGEPNNSDRVNPAVGDTNIYQQFASLSPAIDVFWVNHPLRNATATNQAHLLRVSQEVGLGIPATLITNNIQQVQEFVSSNDATYKLFSATEQGWKEILVPIGDLLNVSDSLVYNSLVLQESIPSQFDVKVAIVGENIFSVALYKIQHSQSKGNCESIRTEIFELPSEIKTSLWQLISKLGLVYATVDLRLTPKYEWVLLGLNPVGDWLSFEEHTQQPITKSLAKLLASCDR
ncbi:ATP-grasp domain-containing protein [Merismopedia glauca]|uniref:ATP-grasp domain-containing protein n=1 Tax=Merismopedia glauca CCAP 1448/3 TaxID=1296344 RepID=A0A2T1C3W2_9CYAN|nr:hypothetical protein [Merismopedia glauca]PSB02941.1 hypothetical protein C7B64_10880 [Merismopedia glauca CCAP 1448/3]